MHLNDIKNWKTFSLSYFFWVQQIENVFVIANIYLFVVFSNEKS